MSLFQDTRLKEVKWKDLVKLSLKDIIIENTISLPWLFVSLLLAYHKHYFFALPTYFFYFLTALRQSHNGYHNSLGTPKWITWLTLYINSILLIASMHAMKYSHLRHHKHCMEEEDIESMCAKMSPIKAIFYGPIFILKTHTSALNSGRKELVRDVWLEIISILLFIGLVFSFDIQFLIFHIVIMTIGEFLSGFFAVWTVHHDCDEHVFARSISPRWKNFLTYNMFYHIEHHLFPKVPTIHLPILAKRLKEKLPDIEVKEVF
jgi:fatty acid desaturase